MAVNPKSLENLRPFTSETAPKGRKNAGLSLLEHINAMADLSRQAVESIRDDESESIIKRRAAERLLDKDDVWSLVDHTHRRPSQSNNDTLDITLRQPQVIYRRHGTDDPLPPIARN